MKRIKDHRRKKQIIWFGGIVLAAAIITLTGWSYYGKMMMGKLPHLSFEEALSYTLKDTEEAVITVGVVKDGQTTYTVYGKNGEILPKIPHTYEIGSLTKTFTAALIGKAVDERLIDLNESMDVYLTLPQGTEYPLVGELVTHTSGYRSHYFEWPMASNTIRGKNSFFGISRNNLSEQLTVVRKLVKEDGFVYSNFGYAALGLILEEVYDCDYGTLMEDFVKDELLMYNTRICDKTGDLSNYWDWERSDAYLPAGALVSDIDDMLTYARVQLDENGFVRTLHQPLRKIEDSGEFAEAGVRIDAMGMSWMIDEENGIIWHNGGTDNYNSYMGFDPSSNTAVVILANLPPSYRIPATILGVKLMNEIRSSNP